MTCLCSTLFLCLLIGRDFADFSIILISFFDFQSILATELCKELQFLLLFFILFTIPSKFNGVLFNILCIKVEGSS